MSIFMSIKAKKINIVLEVYMQKVMSQYEHMNTNLQVVSQSSCDWVKLQHNKARASYTTLLERIYSISFWIVLLLDI